MASSERPAVARGEMWHVALDPVVGPEQAKTRPCVVVQRDAANKSAPTTIVVPLTGAAGRTPSIVSPLLRAGEAGLRKDSVAHCHQVRVVDRLRLKKKTGKASSQAMSAIAEGLRQILDLENL